MDSKREARTIEIYGYIRVSTKEQNEDRQRIALQGLSIPEENIFMDRQSGKDFKRPQYIRLVRKLKPKDMLYVKSIDRLGRNYEEILEQWRRIVKETQANIIVIDMPLLNTASAGGDLTGTFVADLVLQILAYVAETEHSFIKSRQAEGIALARRNGVQFGRKRVEVTNMFEQMFEEWENGKISARAAAGKLHISYSTFYRRCREYEAELEKNG